jgi:hypothetical protein
MNVLLPDFILSSLFMGLGIGLDVAVATAARAKQLSTLKVATMWIVGVTLTHTLFPMLGYLLTYFSIHIQPAIEPLVGLIAFSCIYYYLKGELRNMANASDKNENNQLMVTLGLILAVSWDALWSGPAKSAQVIGWPESLIWASFLVVGLMVLLLAIGSLLSVLKLHQSVGEQFHLKWLPLWIQYSVIGYFGLLALLQYTLGITMYWWQILMLSALLIALFMTILLPNQQSKPSSRLF